MSETWPILKTINWLKSYLEGHGVPEARLHAEHLIAHVLSLSRMELYLQHERILAKDELATLKPLIRRRAAREPLQYIIGTQPFRNVGIKVARGVLIPRPETEIVVEEALKVIPKIAIEHPSPLFDKGGMGELERGKDQIEILDLCTGSGAIAAAIADEREDVRITATETSSAAAGMAKENTKGYGDRVTIIEGDLFQPVSGMTFDMIVSNPPYIPADMWKTLEPEVRDFEPEEALIGGADGLDFFRRIFNDAGRFLKQGGHLVLEMGDGQKDAVVKMAETAGCFAETRTARDLGGKERVFVGRKG